MERSSSPSRCHESQAGLGECCCDEFCVKADELAKLDDTHENLSEVNIFDYRLKHLLKKDRGCFLLPGLPKA